MNVSEALEKRKSVRAFLDKPVEDSLIRNVLSHAGKAPSGVNSQPWEVAVVSGDKKIDLQSKIEQAFRSGQKPKMDYSYYPNEWISPFKDRRKECGLLMYSTLGISRDDKERQMNQWAANYRAFDAPMMLFFFMNNVMQAGSYMDFGMYLQSVMLSAIEEGLATCPQAALGEFPDIVRQELGYADNMTVMCGMAIGYEDDSALINSYRTTREEVNKYTKFYK